MKFHERGIAGALNPLFGDGNRPETVPEKVLAWVWRLYSSHNRSAAGAVIIRKAARLFEAAYRSLRKSEHGGKSGALSIWGTSAEFSWVAALIFFMRC